MVRIIFRANKPMKVGVGLMGLAVMVFIAGAILGDEDRKFTAIGMVTLILAGVVYFVGRTKQILEQRPR